MTGRLWVDALGGVFFMAPPFSTFLGTIEGRAGCKYKGRCAAGVLYGDTIEETSRMMMDAACPGHTFTIEWGGAFGAFAKG